jgi:hypothetical protein
MLDDFAHMGQSLEVVVEQIRNNGPTRVVINDRGMATDPRRALRDHNITPDVVLIRQDGWSLGAPHQFRELALQMWADQWVAIWEQTEDEPTFL